MSIRSASAAIATLSLAGAAMGQGFVGVGIAQVNGNRGVTAGESAVSSLIPTIGFSAIANEVFPGVLQTPGLANAQTFFSAETSGSGGNANATNGLAASIQSSFGNVAELDNTGAGQQVTNGVQVEGNVSAMTYNVNTGDYIIINESGKVFFLAASSADVNALGVPGPDLEPLPVARAAAQFDIPGIVTGAAFDPFASIGYGTYITDNNEIGLFTFGPNQSAFSVLGAIQVDDGTGNLVSLDAGLRDHGLAFDPQTLTLALSSVVADPTTFALSSDIYLIDVAALTADLIFNDTSMTLGGLAPFTPLPTPGAFAAFAGAGLLASRRRR